MLVTISTHVLNTATGLPEAGVPLSLQKLNVGHAGDWHAVGGATLTNGDGRIDSPYKVALDQESTTFKLRFETKGVSVFYPYVEIVFIVKALDSKPQQHFHIPLLLSPFGYSTYRGS
ncbi:transthyretin [Obelidium mucronatum]|nr:transthyretin [Obelidium mucronatum]